MSQPTDATHQPQASKPSLLQYNPDDRTIFIKRMHSKLAGMRKLLDKGHKDLDITFQDILGESKLKQARSSKALVKHRLLPSSTALNREKGVGSEPL